MSSSCWARRWTALNPLSPWYSARLVAEQILQVKWVLDSGPGVRGALRVLTYRPDICLLVETAGQIQTDKSFIFLRASFNEHEKWAFPPVLDRLFAMILKSVSQFSVIRVPGTNMTASLRTVPGHLGDELLLVPLPPSSSPRACVSGSHPKSSLHLDDDEPS